MENTTQTPPSLFQHALKHAAILGVISIVLTLAAYAIDYTLLVSMSFAFLSFAVYLGYGIYAGIQYRKENGGYLAFGKAFQHGFITFNGSINGKCCCHDGEIWRTRRCH
jgi:hypothetical protein